MGAQIVCVCVCVPSPVPRLSRMPPSWHLEKASWCQRVNSAHASARSLAWKPS